MESNVIWVDFRKGRGHAIDWLALAQGCEEQAVTASSEAVRDALLRIAKAYRAKVRPDACSLNG
ncbi:hypothetical protein [uncultured Brevundimonas sp.]|uniref:hypothetical protein n=1 Tax=uncultured Brevundimonas sp. TaxID=213418 RepID=UPI002635D96F|nr:hypothetical protein [uncultured Brevundimonas sp.]